MKEIRKNPDGSYEVADIDRWQAGVLSIKASLSHLEEAMRWLRSGRRCRASKAKRQSKLAAAAARRAADYLEGRRKL